MNDWVKLLRHSNYASTKDSILFNKWNTGGVSTAGCIREFKRNNGIPLNYEIDSDEFTEWLWSLGYVGGGKHKKFMR